MYLIPDSLAILPCAFSFQKHAYSIELTTAQLQETVGVAEWRRMWEGTYPFLRAPTLPNHAGVEPILQLLLNAAAPKASVQRGCTAERPLACC